MTTLIRFDVHKLLRCSESTLQNWLTLIEANYNNANPYHNSTHAADVLHAVAYFLEAPKVKEYMDDLDDAASLIAAVLHDVNHPGRNSAFLCNNGNDLAYLYNDITVLENHHAALGFKLSMSDERVNIFKVAINLCSNDEAMRMVFLYRVWSGINLRRFVRLSSTWCWPRR